MDERILRVGLLGGLLLAAGCSTTRTSDTARTGMEQLLVSNAVDQSLDKIDFSPFAHQAIFLDEKYLDCVDKNYIVASVRHRLLRQQATLVGKPEEAAVVLEIRSGGVGTDNSDSYIGVPEIVLPGMITLPEIRLMTRTQQKGIAKLGLVAYDAKTKRALGEGGMSLAQSNDSNLYVLGVGPYQNGSVRVEVKEGLSAGRANSEELPQQVAFQRPRSTAVESDGQNDQTLPAGYESVAPPFEQPSDTQRIARPWWENGLLR